LWLIALLIGMSWGVWKKFVKAFAVFLGILFGVLAFAPVVTPTITVAVRAAFMISALLIYVGYLIGRRDGIKAQHVITLWAVLSALLVLVILPGFNGNPILPKVETTAWGGLMITLLLAVGGIVLSFPIGVLLALGVVLLFLS